MHNNDIEIGKWYRVYDARLTLKARPEAFVTSDGHQKGKWRCEVSGLGEPMLMWLWPNQLTGPCEPPEPPPKQESQPQPDKPIDKPPDPGTLTALGKQVILATCDLVWGDPGFWKPEEIKEWVENESGDEGYATHKVAETLDLPRRTVAGALGTLIPAGWCTHGEGYDYCPEFGQNDKGNGEYIYPTAWAWKLWFEERHGENGNKQEEKPMKEGHDYRGLGGWPTHRPHNH